MAVYIKDYLTLVDSPTEKEMSCCRCYYTKIDDITKQSLQSSINFDVIDKSISMPRQLSLSTSETLLKVKQAIQNRQPNVFPSFCAKEFVRITIDNQFFYFTEAEITNWCDAFADSSQYWVRAEEFSAKIQIFHCENFTTKEAAIVDAYFSKILTGPVYVKSFGKLEFSIEQDSYSQQDIAGCLSCYGWSSHCPAVAKMILRDGEFKYKVVNSKHDHHGNKVYPSTKNERKIDESEMVKYVLPEDIQEVNYPAFKPTTFPIVPKFVVTNFRGHVQKVLIDSYGEELIQSASNQDHWECRMRKWHCQAEMVVQTIDGEEKAAARPVLHNHEWIEFI